MLLKIRFLLFCTALLVLSCSCGGKIKQSISNRSDVSIIQPVVHLTFDEGAEDYSKNQLHANLKSGATICTDSAVGKGAVCLDGVDDYVELAGNTVYFKGDYSISLWCKWESLGEWTRILDFNAPKPGEGNGLTWLIGRKDTRDMSMMWFDQWIKHDGLFVESIIDFNNTPAEPEMAYNIQQGKWEHYVLVYESNVPNHIGEKLNIKGEVVPFSGRVSLYVNGNKISENYHALKPQNVSTIKNHLGKSPFPSDPSFNGIMDDFRIYEQALSAKQVKQLHALGDDG